ncbi:MAG: NAD(P)-dependent oxidoreductase [Candidatus Thorarchaeota archaeon]
MNKLNANRNVKVCFISDIPENAKEYLIEGLKDLPNVLLVFPKDRSKENLFKLIKDADVLIGWRPSLEILEYAEKMRFFINPGAGVHHLLEDFKEINKKRNVTLINGHGNSYFVAQHTVALLLSLMNMIIPHHEWMKEGKWRTGDDDAASIPLRFKNVGLLGYGAINKKVHKMLSGFNVSFSILRKDWSHIEGTIPSDVRKYTFNQLHDFLKEVDILIIAVPVTKLTINMIDEKELALLRPNGILVNVSRGEIVNQEALYKILKNDEIIGAAIDVWYESNPQSDNQGRKYPFHYPFHLLNNIVLSPHRGYSPFNDLLRWNEVIENIKRIAYNRTDLLNVVNLKEEY